MRNLLDTIKAELKNIDASRESAANEIATELYSVLCYGTPNTATETRNVEKLADAIQEILP